VLFGGVHSHSPLRIPMACRRVRRRTDRGRACFQHVAESATPNDFRLVFHNTLHDSYENSVLMLARAGVDGTLQLLTAGWERVLGYDRAEFMGKNLNQLMWFNRGSAAAAVTAILDEEHLEPVHMRRCCRMAPARASRCIAITTSWSR
jgi:PAS domain-containing protein